MIGDIYFISVGAGIEQIYGIDTVKKMGYKVLAFDVDNNAIGKNSADIFYNIDIKEKEKIYEIAKQYNIKGVIPSPIGKMITTVGYLNDKLNLKGPSEKICSICSNKNAINKFLKHHNFNYPKEYSINDIDDILFPVIVKPQYGSGSKNVKIVYNKEELLEYINHYDNNSFYGNLMINEFIEGQEYGVDAAIISGEIKFLNIREKVMTEAPYRQELQYISPANLYINEKTNIYNTIKNFALLMGVKDCLLNADIIINGGGNSLLI